MQKNWITNVKSVFTKDQSASLLVIITLQETYK
jgi:hypothetical protein